MNRRRHSVLVLGPTKWEEGTSARSVMTIEPTQTREDIARAIRAGGLDAFLLENDQPSTGETHTAFMFRKIHDENVQTFVVYWPLGARILGLEKEFGHLLEWLERGFLIPDQVVLLVERGHLRDDPAKGVMSINEPGNQTQWHEDFIAYGVPQRIWSSNHSLFRHVGSIAMEHRMRKPTPWSLPLVAERS